MALPILDESHFEPAYFSRSFTPQKISTNRADSDYPSNSEEISSFISTIGWSAGKNSSSSVSGPIYEAKIAAIIIHTKKIKINKYLYL